LLETRALESVRQVWRRHDAFVGVFGDVVHVSKLLITKRQAKGETPCGGRPAKARGSLPFAVTWLARYALDLLAVTSQIK
jgi:hypothetical protein